MNPTATRGAAATSVDADVLMEKLAAVGDHKERQIDTSAYTKEEWVRVTVETFNKQRLD